MSAPVTNPKGKPTDSIVSCEATSTTGAPTLPTPTEKEFTVSIDRIVIYEHIGIKCCDL
jgi:hypothetical protein